MRIAFIGLGNMGLPMAANLVRAGFEVHGFDLAGKALKAFANCGGHIAASPLEAAQDSPIVITMLPRGEHVLALFEGPNALVPALNTSTLFIDCSTIAVHTAQHIAKIVQASGHAFIDAPVSGGTRAAASAGLTFMVGASDADLARAQPVLAKMGSKMVHVGAVGAGQVAKICNNMLLAIQMAGTSEALALGIANGLDPKVLSEIMRRSSGGNWTLEVYNPVPGVQENSAASRGYTGGFGTDLMLKDLGLALNNAVKTKAATPLGTLARSLYATHSLQGRGAEDFSSIIKLLQKPA